MVAPLESLHFPGRRRALTRRGGSPQRVRTSAEQHGPFYRQAALVKVPAMTGPSPITKPPATRQDLFPRKPFEQ